MTKEKLEALRKDFELTLPILVGIILGENSSKYEDVDLLSVSTCELVMKKVKKAEMPLDGDMIETDELYNLADDIAEEILRKLTK